MIFNMTAYFKNWSDASKSILWPELFSEKMVWSDEIARSDVEIYSLLIFRILLLAGINLFKFLNTLRLVIKSWTALIAVWVVDKSLKVTHFDDPTTFLIVLNDRVERPMPATPNIK